MNNDENAFNVAKAFISESVIMGYKVDGSVFKIDYSGSGWSVGFWFRPVGWDQKSDYYRLPGRCRRGKDKDLLNAVCKAIKAAMKEEEFRKAIGAFDK